MKIKYLCLAICLAWSGVAAAETVQQASAVSVAAAKSDDELRAKEIELKVLEKTLELNKEKLEIQEKVVAGQQKSVDWWINIVSLIFAITSIAIPYLIARVHRKQMEQEFNDVLENLKQTGEKAKQDLRQMAQDFEKLQKQLAILQTGAANLQKSQSSNNHRENAAVIQAAEEIQSNPMASEYDKLFADAMKLSKQATSYDDFKRVYHAWLSVWEQNKYDEQVCFYLGFWAQILYAKGTREQQLYWQSEIEKWYVKALQIKPDFYEVAINLGVALNHEAQALQQENKFSEAYKKWQKAGECYQQGLQIKPDLHHAANNWGITLDNEAQALQQENKFSEAYEKWQQAGQRYEQALQIKPDFHEAANNWGSALSHEAKALQQENRLPEAYEKWQQAGQHYQQALQIKSDFHDAANNWGSALDDEAQTLRQENKLSEAYEKWQQAWQCYQQALQIKPDKHEAANNWVIGLLKMYQAIKAENLDMATQALQQAKQIAHDFLAKYPQYAPYFAYDTACLFALENNLPKAIEQLKLAQQSDNFPDKAHILQDKDLDNIRESSEFQAWLKEAFPDTE